MLGGRCHTRCCKKISDFGTSHLGPLGYIDAHPSTRGWVRTQVLEFGSVVRSGSKTGSRKASCPHPFQPRRRTFRGYILMSEKCRQMRTSNLLMVNRVPDISSAIRFASSHSRGLDDDDDDVVERSPCATVFVQPHLVSIFR